jgi:hypothetical protein
MRAPVHKTFGARRVANNLTKRERNAIDYISYIGSDLNAYSLSFDVTPTRIRRHHPISGPSG